MMYHTVTLPSNFTAEKDGSRVRYYKGASAVVAALAGKQAKVVSVHVLRHSAVSAFRGTDEAANEKTLAQWFSVANDPMAFIPIASAIWAGVAPSDQEVDGPVQLQFLASGAVNIRVAPAWLEHFESKKLRVACETWFPAHAGIDHWRNPVEL